MKDLEKKIRYDFFDLLKAIAIFFVIIYHFNNFNSNILINTSISAYWNYFFQAILSTCVPIFFFVNGALLLNKSELDIKKHIRKMISIVIVILIWSVITLVSLSYIRYGSLTFSVFGIARRIFDLRIGWINHFWFLEALIVIYIFLPLIFTSFKNNIKHFYFFFVCVLILTFGNKLISDTIVVVNCLFHLFSAKELYSNYFSDFNAFRGIFGYSIGYFMLGGILFYHKDKINFKKYRTIAIITILISMSFLFLFGIFVSKSQNLMLDIVWDGYDTLFTLANVVALYIISFNYSHKGLFGRFIKLTGENSLGIFLIHVIIGNLFNTLYLKFEFSHLFIVNIIYSVLILLVSLIIVIYMQRSRFLKFFIAIK